MEHIDKYSAGHYTASLLMEKNVPANGKEKITGDEEVGGPEIKQGLPAAVTDRVELSGGGTGIVSEDDITNLLWKLRNENPDVTILVQEREEEVNLKQLAARLGKGRFVVVTRDFLDRMKLNTDEFEHCKNILTDTIHKIARTGDELVSAGTWLDGKTKKEWSVSAGRESAAELNKNCSLFNSMAKAGSGMSAETLYRKSNPVSYRTSGQYASLARAGSKAEVQKVLGDVHRSISSLSLIVSLGDEKESIKARKAISSLKKLLSRGRKKISRLEKEEALNCRKKKAERNRKEKEVLKIRLEMKKKRAARYGADARLKQEGISDTYYIMSGVKSRRYEEKYRDSYVDGAGIPGNDPGVTGPVGGGETGFSASDVVVSDGGSF